MLSTADEHDAMLQHWSPAFSENEVGIQKRVRAFLPPPIAPAADPMESEEGAADKDVGGEVDVTMGEEGKDAPSTTDGEGKEAKQEKAKAKDSEEGEEDETVETDDKEANEGEVVDAMGDARRALLGRAIQVRRVLGISW